MFLPKHTGCFLAREAQSLGTTFSTLYLITPLSSETGSEHGWHILHLSLAPESALPQREHMCAFLLPVQSAARTAPLKEGLIPGPGPGSLLSTNTDPPSPESVFSVTKEVMDLTSGFCLFFLVP